MRLARWRDSNCVASYQAVALSCISQVLSQHSLDHLPGAISCLHLQPGLHPQQPHRNGCSSVVLTLLLFMGDVNSAVRILQEQLVEAVEDRGFDARLLGEEGSSILCVHIGGMTCSHCSDSIQTALMRHPGVSHVSVSVLTNRAQVRPIALLQSADVTARRHQLKNRASSFVD